MITKVKQKIVRSTINISELVHVDGSPKLFNVTPIEVVGKISPAKAQRLADQTYKGKRVVVLDIDYQTTHYEVDLMQFLEIAKEVK